MAGPTKSELERFYAAFGAFVDRCPSGALHRGLADLIELHDKIAAAGALRSPTGRPRIPAFDAADMACGEVLPG